MMRYKAHVHVVFEVECESAKLAKEAAQLKLDAILPAEFDFYSLCISQMPARPRGANRRRVLGEFKIEDVLPHVTEEKSRRDFMVKDEAYSVRMNSTRYLLFNRSLKCVSCGLVGIKFLLEISSGAVNPHFNLYAEEDGKLVLMTKDHKLAASRGGTESLDNLQVMCSTCNMLKANHSLTPAQVFELRKMYKKQLRGVSSKLFSKMLVAARIQMEKDNQIEEGKKVEAGLLSSEAGYNDGVVNALLLQPALEELVNV